MSVSPRPGRRQFLTQGSAAAVAIAALPTALAGHEVAAPAATCPATLNASEQACLRQFGPGDFEPLVGEHFRAGAPGQSTMLQLVAVTRPSLHAQDARPGGARAEPFSLLFLAKNDRPLEAAIHEFEHLALGRLKAYVNAVRAHEDPRHTHYEVVFG